MTWVFALLAVVGWLSWAIVCFLRDRDREDWRTQLRAARADLRAMEQDDMRLLRRILDDAKREVDLTTSPRYMRELP